MVLDPRDPLSLAPRIEKQIPGSKFQVTGPPQFLKRPTAPMSPQDFCVTFSLRLPPVIAIAGLTIRVVTAAAPQASRAQRTIARVDLKASPADPRVTANVEYAQQDLQSLTADEVKHGLADVAMRAYMAARSRNLIPGKDAPQPFDLRDTRMGDAGSEVTRVYQLHGTALGKPDWPEPRARLDFFNPNPQSEFCLDDAQASAPPGGSAEPRLEFCVDNAQVAAAAQVQVIFDSQFQPTDADKGSRLLMREGKALNGRFATLLGSLERTVPSQEAVLAVVKGLATAPEVAVDTSHKVTVTTPPESKRELWFQAYHQWKDMLGFTAKGEFSYSPEKKFVGGGNFDSGNLMRLRETESFQLEAGNQVQTASGSLIVDRHKKVQYGARADGKLEYNASQRFGSLMGPKLRARDESITPEVYLNYPFADPNQPVTPLGFSTTSSAGLEFRNLKVSPQSGPAPPDSSGNANGVFIQLGPYYSVEPRRPKGGVGRFGAGLDITGRQSFPGLGTDFDYRQMRLSGSVELFFGFAQAKDFLLRHKRGTGFSDGRVPLFDLFQLGGTGSVRGLEQGEYVGRGFGFEQYEAGATIRPVWNWIASLTKKRRPTKSREMQVPTRTKATPIRWRRWWTLRPRISSSFTTGARCETTPTWATLYG
jgi:Omp85 superfamily domain